MTTYAGKGRQFTEYEAWVKACRDTAHSNESSLQILWEKGMAVAKMSNGAMRSKVGHWKGTMERGRGLLYNWEARNFKTT